MATWQFDILVVPPGALRGLARDGGERVPPSLVRERRWWREGELPFDRLDVVMAPLSLSQFWDDESYICGDESGNCLLAFGPRAGLEEVRVRLDARHVDGEFIGQVMRVTRALGCVLLTEEGEVVQPDQNVVVRELHNSTAHRFTVNPRAFLSEEDEMMEDGLDHG